MGPEIYLFIKNTCLSTDSRGRSQRISNKLDKLRTDQKVRKGAKNQHRLKHKETKCENSRILQ